MEQLFITTGWVMLFAFAVTFLVSILALTRVIRLADDRYLKLLFVKMICEVVAAGLFLFYNGTFNYEPPWVGTWKARIDWSAEFSQTLFNHGGKAAFIPASPRSEGTVYIVKFRKSYTGFSLWETKNGGDTYSKLFVRIENFHFKDSRPERWDLTTAVRQKLVEFPYGPFFSYSMIFDQASESHLAGAMVVRDQEGKDREVGKVVLEKNL